MQCRSRASRTPGALQLQPQPTLFLAAANFFRRCMAVCGRIGRYGVESRATGGLTNKPAGVPSRRENLRVPLQPLGTFRLTETGLRKLGRPVIYRGDPEDKRLRLPHLKLAPGIRTYCIVDVRLVPTASRLIVVLV